MTRVLPLLLVAVAACGGGAPPETPSTPSPAPAEEVVVLTPAAREAAGVTSAPVERAMVAEGLEAPAVLALDETRTARVGAVVEGIVVQTFAEVGAVVRQGFVLAWLHSRVVHDAWADYRKALAERRRLASELAFAQAAEARAERLLRDKALARQDVERARADRVAVVQQLDMAGTELRRAEEALEHLGVTNKEDPSGESGEQIPVRAPFAGVVLQRDVGPGTAVTPGTQLFVVSDLSTLWALAELDETQLGAVHVGDAVQLRVPAWPDQAFAGQVTFVGDAVNPKTRRVTVRCAIPNPDRRLKAEMFATVTLGTGASRTALVVPAGAVQEMQGQPHVFVEDAAGAFRPRAVELGATLDGRVEVRSGLAQGERVATAGTFLLKSELAKGRLAGDE